MTNELPPPISIRVRMAWYGLTFFAALLFPCAGYRLDCVSLNAPLIYESNLVMFNDTLLILPMVQSMLEGGTHWVCDRLGFPGRQELYDFPVVDHFHFMIAWFIGRLTGSTVLTFNLYYLLGYALAALTMLAVLREFRVSFPAAVVAALLFACSPYHQFRGQNHFFLSAYYVIPFPCMVMLWICTGRLPFFTNQTFRIRDRTTIVAAFIMLVTSASGAYYAFFACGLFVAAGFYGWLANRNWRAMASAGGMIALITFGGFVNHLPTFLHHWEFGRHTRPVERMPEEAELYGLKISQLLFPIDDHRLRPLAEFKSIYNSFFRPVQAYTERYGLGLITALGFVGLMIRLLLPLPRKEPFSSLAALTGFAVAIGVVGGMGAIFNQIVTPSVRCYNRIAIYIAFFSLFAVAVAGDQWLQRLRMIWQILIGFCVLAFGLWDATPNEWGTDDRAEAIQNNQRRWFEDADYFRQIEETMSPGAAIFQLPFVAFPESAPTQGLAAYEHARGYLHTRTLRWSFGCMKGRETDDWQRSVSILAPNAVARMLDRICLAGFEGLFFDKRGYTSNHAALLEAQLMQAIAGAKPIRHPDGQQVFFDLRRHRDDIRAGRDWAAEQRRELQRPVILWLDGFVTFREPGHEWRERWCGPRGLAIFVNPTNETQTITSTFRLHTELRDASKLTVEGGELWSEELIIDRNSPSITRTFSIPPGRHSVRFRCDPPLSHMPTEYRRLIFKVSGLKLD